MVEGLGVLLVLVVWRRWSRCNLVMPELGKVVGRLEVKHTSEYHFKASSGMLYCLALSSRSLTSLGKTASKSLSLFDGDLVVGIGPSSSVVCCIFQWSMSARKNCNELNYYKTC